MDPDSEAMQILRLTTQSMAMDVAERGRRFSFIILPTLQEIRNYRRNRGFRDRWDQMSGYLCAGDFECHDLMDYFQDVPYDTLDVVCDKWHFGPRTNQHLANALLGRVLQ